MRRKSNPGNDRPSGGDSQQFRLQIVSHNSSRSVGQPVPWLSLL
jgi:hypothetical protein